MELNKLFYRLLSVFGIILACVAIYFAGKYQEMYQYYSWFTSVLAFIGVLCGVLSSKESKKEVKESLTVWGVLGSIFHLAVFLYFGWWVLFAINFLTTVSILSVLNEKNYK